MHRAVPGDMYVYLFRVFGVLRVQQWLQRELLYGLCGCLFFCLYGFNQRELRQFLFCGVFRQLRELMLIKLPGRMQE